MDFGSIIEAALPSLIQSGSSLFGNLYKPVDPNTTATLDYDKGRDTANLALEQDKLQQAMAIAQMDAASRAAAAGATVRAAGLQAGAENNATHQRGLQAGLEGRMNQVKFLNPEVRNAAATNLSSIQEKGGESAQSGLLALAQLLQNPLLRQNSAQSQRLPL